MSDLNNVSMTGRLVKDAERITLPNGTGLVKAEMANNTGFGKYEKTLYLTINLWGKSGDSVLPYLTKGKSVAVSGELEMQKWTSKEGGERTSLALNCNKIMLLGTGGGSSAPAPEAVNEEPLF